MAHLGEELKLYRREMNIKTQAEMATVLGIGARTYQTIEATGNVAKAEDAKRIEEILKPWRTQKVAHVGMEPLLVELLKRQNEIMARQNSILERQTVNVEGKIIHIETKVGGIETNLTQVLEASQWTAEHLRTMVQREMLREAGGNQAKAEELLNEINKRSASKIRSSQKRGSVRGEGR